MACKRVAFLRLHNADGKKIRIELGEHKCQVTPLSSIYLATHRGLRQDGKTTVVMGEASGVCKPPYIRPPPLSHVGEFERALINAEQECPALRAAPYYLLVASV